MRHRRLLACLLLLCAGTAAAAPAGLSVQQFLAPNQFVDLKISPDGEHYATTVPLEDRTALVILRRADLARTGYVMFDAEQHVASFHWVNARQLVYTAAVRSGPLAAPRARPTLYRINADGSQNQPVSRDLLHLAHLLPDDDDHILVSHMFVGRGKSPVARLNLATGQSEITKLRSSPLRRGVYFTDNAGNIRFESGTAFEELTTRLYQLDDDGKWHLVSTEKESGHHVYVNGFSADNRTAYFIIEQDDGPDGFFAYDMQTRERRLVARHARADIGRTLYSPIDGGVIALEYFDGKPELKVIEPGDPFVAELQKVMRAFPGAYVTPTSYTRDGRTGIYLVSSDVNSGEFYRVDHDTGQATFIAARNDLFDPALMSPMQVVRIKARDGLEIPSLLTVPRGLEGRPLPMVVMPHGGPKGLFDNWGFDREVQLLASRGYVVLQPNFRGSGNYGRDFREAGNGEWGAKMQDDVTDVTRWAVQQRIAAPGRICLYGASYGAYSTMMGLVREPGLYACGIGNVGVYDLVKMYGTHKRVRSNKQYFDVALGDVDLASISPARLGKYVSAPVLLGAGELDRTTPVEQTRDMHAALTRAGVSVDMVVYPNEAHGYYLLKNRLDWAERVLAFLDTHIGAARGSGAVAATHVESDLEP